MTRVFQIGGLLLLAASGLAAQKGGGKAPKLAAPALPGRGPGARPNNLNKDGEFRNGAGVRQGPGGRLPNPLGNPVQRLVAMPPEQRERILEKLPPQQQANIRRRLEEFDQLPPAEKTRRLQLWESFTSLPAEKQQILARQLPAYNALPDDRRKVLLKAMVRLWRMPESDRQARLNSDEFKSQFSQSEWQMISDISQNYPFRVK